jgi:hypothetical protein
MVKQVLIGLVGLYRTFKQTAPFLFEKLIHPNQNKYKFKIIINTDLICTDRHINKGYGWKPALDWKYSNNDDLDRDLRKCYNKYNQLKDIIYYSNENKSIGGTGIFKKRIKQILNKEEKEYELYIFIRLDVYPTEIINLDNFLNKASIIASSNITSGQLHKRDIDWCWLGGRKHFLMFINTPLKSCKNIDLNMDDVVEICNKTKLKGKFYKNIEKKGIMGRNWVLKWYKLFYYMFQNNCNFDLKHERERLYVKIIR